MKRCPECRRDYHDDSMLYCLDDGCALLEGPGRGAEDTAILGDIGATSESTTRHYGDSTQTQPQPQGAVTAAGTTRKRVWLVCAIAALLLAIVGGGAYLWVLRGRAPVAPVAALQNMKFNVLPAAGGTGWNAISPDGKLIARAFKEGGKTGINLRQVGSSAGERVLMSATEAYWMGQTFSPDSSSVYFVSGVPKATINSLYRLPVIGGDPQKLIDDVDSMVTFSPDGKSIGFRRHTVENEDTLVIADADGRNERIAAHYPSPPSRFVSLAWAPDGKKILYSMDERGDNGPSTFLEELDVATGSAERLTSPGWRFMMSVGWLPDGRGIIITGTPNSVTSNTPAQLWYVSYPSGEIFQITNDAKGYASTCLTADGRTALTSQTTLYSNIWSMPADSPAKLTQITNSTAVIGDLSWTPDGRLIYQSNQSGNADLWVMNADGSGNRQLTFTPENENNPNVSADGRYVVYRWERTGSYSVHRMNIDGTGVKELVQKSDGGALPQISPDSGWVYYSGNDPSEARRGLLLKVPMDGGEPQEIHAGTANHRISPDGQYAVGTVQLRQQNQPFELSIFSLNGGHERRLPSPANFQWLVWAPDGKAIDFILTRDGVTNVWRMPTVGGPLRQISPWKVDSPLYSMAWSRDGKTLAMVRDSSTTDLVLIQNFR